MQEPRSRPPTCKIRNFSLNGTKGPPNVRRERHPAGLPFFNYQKHMQKTIRFFKISEGPQKGWYADVPNHTLEENEMVAGSDTFLEEVDKQLGDKGEVFINVSDDNLIGAFEAKLIMKNHNQFGATYILTGPLAEYYDAVGFELWICNVTHDVLGEHPRSIYIHGIR